MAMKDFTKPNSVCSTANTAAGKKTAAVTCKSRLIALGGDSSRADDSGTLLAGIHALAPDIAARAAEIEAARCVPADLAKRLRSIGFFRMFVPRSHGGMELDLPTGLQISTALARIDGSVGWTATIGSGSSLFVPLLPRETYDRIYRNSPDVIIVGSTAPLGKAEAVPGGWRVSGRWPFASGCQIADWIAGFCVMTENGKPISGQAGQPLVRAVLLAAPDWQIEDTWHAAGLKGTGSHDVVLDGVFAPQAQFFDFEASPCVPGPVHRTVPHFLPLFLGAVAVGIAEGALDDLVELANTGRQQFGAASLMRESETFQYEVGRIAADLKAARAFLEFQAASHWRHAEAGTLKGEAVLIEGVHAGTWIVSTCVRVADACFTLGGGSAVYESSPLQRRMRDLHAAKQHARIHERHYAAAGKAALTGRDRHPE